MAKKPQLIHAEAFDLKNGKFDPFGLARSIVEDFMIFESLAHRDLFENDKKTAKLYLFGLYLLEEALLDVIPEFELGLLKDKPNLPDATKNLTPKQKKAVESARAQIRDKEAFDTKHAAFNFHWAVLNLANDYVSFLIYLTPELAKDEGLLTRMTMQGLMAVYKALEITISDFQKIPLFAGNPPQRGDIDVRLLVGGPSQRGRT